MSGFYLPFMRAVHEGLGGAVTLSAITHVGLGGLTNGQLFGLEEQVEHKRQWLEEHLLRPGSPPCALIGHSIGESLVGGHLWLCSSVRSSSALPNTRTLPVQARIWRCVLHGPSNRACQRLAHQQDTASSRCVWRRSGQQIGLLKGALACRPNCKLTA